MKLIDYIMIIGIILLIFGGVFMYLYLKNQGVYCMNNPIQFYQVKENTSCFCMNELPIF